MKYISLFSGVEAASLAFEPLGWVPVAFAEFDKFPSAVLAHHWPKVPNFGDVTTITEQQIKQLGEIDLLVFGSPCQDLSVAGKREGLNGERSGLFRTAIRIISWCKKHCKLKKVLWENVPGCLSSNEGADFLEVLQSLCGSKLDQPQKWSEAGFCFGKSGLVEWSVLDAQYFGVPQRRRRVYVVADFGDWTNRRPIFFESESVPGHPKSSSTQRKDTTEVVRENSSSWGSWPARTTNTICAAYAEKRGLENQHIDSGATLFVPTGSHWDNLNSPHPTLTQSSNTGGIGMSDQELFAQRGAGLVPCLTPYDQLSYGEYGSGKLSSTLLARDCKGPSGLVVHGSQDPCVSVGIAHTVCTNKGLENVLLETDGVRRLMPIEGERLQGMPDDHTKVPFDGKELADCPDGHRYKAIGNSMPIVVMNWVGKRIDEESHYNG
ncbi:DNA (cytosine-5-)-methyltransferase [Pseudoalteromonas sp. Of7M-16]|uniref:DNA cytosine methyltransferase n=1 Tax=Pseudoalteromonas sp. Of7M-16 TaxID=2917756 RepID=UPI001EF5729F|nr:DNA (cytosine-5-)-methyltransferase [Pseudoalteromonas sp. Of7M-16]MCG7548232.1 DNA cytosine methyltransferase [Pseudoalteromonas sp. Of7M-16]